MVVLLTVLAWASASQVRAEKAMRDVEKRAMDDRQLVFEVSERLRASQDLDAIVTESTTLLARYLGLSRCAFIEGTADTDARDDLRVLVLGEDETKATLVCSRERPAPWTARDEALARAVADRTWQAIAELRLEAERKRLVIELTDLSRDLELRIEARTRDLRDAVREREVLLQEVHHRVKNNLQVIASLINMQLRGLVDGAARSALNDCRSRVQAIALVHEKLYQTQHYVSVQFAEYARSLVANVFEAVGKKADAVELRLDIADVELGIDKAIPCGLIMNELIVNALKHGFPGERPGAVTVTLERLDTAMARLTVTDDGAGLAPGLEPMKARSLGMRLISTLARQLQGTFQLRDDAGVTAVVTFPFASHDPVAGGEARP